MHSTKKSQRVITSKRHSVACNLHTFFKKEPKVNMKQKMRLSSDLDVRSSSSPIGRSVVTISAQSFPSEPPIDQTVFALKEI